MKSLLTFVIVFTLVIILATACVDTPAPTVTLPLPTNTTAPTPQPTMEPTPAKTILGVVKDGFCYGGPGTNYPVQSLAVPGQYFEILGRNHDDSWFSIDPTAMVDPDPPYNPVNEMMDPDPPYSPRCWVLSDVVELIGGLESVPVVQVPRLGVVEQTDCYSGPGDNHHIISTLYPEQFFDILGIDDDVTWAENTENQIDDDVTWFQVDLTALIDPEPPYSELEAILGGCSSYFQGLPRCWVPGDSVATSGDLTMLPVIETPRLGVIVDGGCFAGPGEGYEVKTSLITGQYFEILAIDDDVTWQENAENQIDDDVTWFEIDPTALIDPDPPYRPLNELSPQPDPPGSQVSLRCWVRADTVQTSGDLRNLPFPTVPFMAVMEDVYCYTGPGYNYKAMSRVLQNQLFSILGIDDDVTWIDDDVTWRENGWVSIDDDVTWFNIDPIAIMDPDPPYRPFNMLVDPVPPYSLLSTRCWVPVDKTAFCGDLLWLPVLPAPVVILPTLTPTVQVQPPPPNCSAINDFLVCQNTEGCHWGPEQTCVND